MTKYTIISRDDILKLVFAMRDWDPMDGPFACVAKDVRMALEALATERDQLQETIAQMQPSSSEAWREEREVRELTEES